jgi:hypothetical protein
MATKVRQVLIDEDEHERLRALDEEVKGLRTALELIAPKVPKAFAELLGPFETILYDKGCLLPIGWGHKIKRKLEDHETLALKMLGDIEYLGGDEGSEFGLVVRWLTPDEAQAKYGAPHSVELGPRGGFRQVMYGSTPFNHKKMRP